MLNPVSRAFEPCGKTAEIVSELSSNATDWRIVTAAPRLTRPHGGYVLWVELPRTVDALELHRRALAQKISIAPGPIFSAKQKFKNFIRLSCGLPWSGKIDTAVQTLGKLAQKSGTRYS